jgi:ATP-dependent 26S proteasome regulatory subunit
VPVKNKKELIKEKEDNKLYGTINSVNIQQERIEKLKKIDNFIKEESETEEEDLVNNRFENLSLNKEVNTRLNNSPYIVSTVIEEYKREYFPQYIPVNSFFFNTFIVFSFII